MLEECNLRKIAIWQSGCLGYKWKWAWATNREYCQNIRIVQLKKDLFVYNQSRELQFFIPVYAIMPKWL